MKLIMENWGKFLKENEATDPKWLDHLKQIAMEYVAANPEFKPEGIAGITLSTLAAEGAEIAPEYLRSLDTPLGQLLGIDLEAATADIMQGASEFASDEAPLRGSSPWASPEVPDEEGH